MTHILIPREPSTALLRPFIGCNNQELHEAWAAMVRIAEVQHDRADSQCLAQIEEPPQPVAPQGVPVGEIVLFGGDLKEVSWAGGKMPPPGTKLYAGAAPAAATGPANDLAELAMLNKLVELGTQAYGALAKSNSDDGPAGTAAYVRWQERRAEMGELIRAHKAPALEAPAAPAAPRREVTDGTRTLLEDCISAIRDYACSRPEEGESWESWFEAAFDLCQSRVRRVFDDHALAAAPQAPNCTRCSGSGEDPEGYLTHGRGPDDHTVDGPCRECDGTGAAPQAPAALDELGKIAAIAACWGCDHPDEPGDTELLRRVKWAARQLRAVSQAPAAPVGDEREAFEAWIKKDGGDLSTFGSGQNRHYNNSAVNNAWTGWSSRAAQTAPAAPVAAAIPDAAYCALQYVEHALAAIANREELADGAFQPMDSIGKASKRAKAALARLQSVAHHFSAGAAPAAPAVDADPLGPWAKR